MITYLKQKSKISISIEEYKNIFFVVVETTENGFALLWSSKEDFLSYINAEGFVMKIINKKIIVDEELFYITSVRELYETACNQHALKALNMDRYSQKQNNNTKEKNNMKKITERQLNKIKEVILGITSIYPFSGVFVDTDLLGRYNKKSVLLNQSVPGDTCSLKWENACFPCPKEEGSYIVNGRHFYVKSVKITVHVNSGSSNLASNALGGKDRYGKIELQGYVGGLVSANILDAKTLKELAQVIESN